MSSIFSGPKMPQQQQTVTPVAVTDTSKATEEARLRAARKRGLASNILAGDYRTGGQPVQTTAKTLLGQ